MINNSSGKIFYGMHFYPGLAQYDGSGKESFKIYLNENVLRKMDPTFAGRPIFVEHVNEVDPNLDNLRKEADGWVVESFFNEADGKHWTKFVAVSDNAFNAIKNGYRLSNSYIPKLSGRSGVWNGIPYEDEVIDGEYEHLAIVKNPRYDESIIMNPEEFKAYNENLKLELNRISNSKERNMKLNFWTKKTVENSMDIEKLCISLPKSGKEYTIMQIVNAMDEMEEKKKENMADLSSKVKLHDGTMCNVGELIEKFKGYAEEKKKNEEMSTETDLEPESVPLDVEGDLHNQEDEEAKKKAIELAAHEEKEIKEEKMKNKKMKNDSTHFNSLKNAHLNVQNQEIKLDLSENKLARGKSRYGSN